GQARSVPCKSHPADRQRRLVHHGQCILPATGGSRRAGIPTTQEARRKTQRRGPLLLTTAWRRSQSCKLARTWAAGTSIEMTTAWPGADASGAVGTLPRYQFL